MFCKECGNQIPGDAKFCSGCGAPLTDEVTSQPIEQEDSGEPLLVLRPVFIPWVAVLSVLPAQMFMTVWGAGFLGGFSMVGLRALKVQLPTWFTFVFFGCLFFFGIPILAYVAKKRTYAKTEYRFFRDRLEYAEGFWTVENKTTKYKNIIETNLRKGIVQRAYKLGTIYLATPATGMQQGTRMSGIKVRDIEEPEKVYEMVRNLIG